MSLCYLLIFFTPHHDIISEWNEGTTQPIEEVHAPVRCVKDYTNWRTCGYDPNAAWNEIDPNCDKTDIIINNGTTDITWAGCNSTLGDGESYLSDDTGDCIDPIKYEGYYSYNITGYLNNWFLPLNSCDGTLNKETDIGGVTPAIFGSMYMRNDRESACIPGRHLPNSCEMLDLYISYGWTGAKHFVNDELNLDFALWNSGMASGDLLYDMGFPLGGALEDNGPVEIKFPSHSRGAKGIYLLEDDDKLEVGLTGMLFSRDYSEGGMVRCIKDYPGRQLYDTDCGITSEGGFLR